MNAFYDEIAALRPQLLRVARRQVRNEAWAEDAVSETLVAALENPTAYAGRAQTRAWLVGILRHKLADQLRRHLREQPLAEASDEADDGDPFDLAECHGPAAGWGDPQATLARRQFVREVDAALEHLPQRQGRAFVLRECLDEDTADVCRELGVTANHLGVMLHRARQRLRTLLATQWAPAAQSA